MKLSFCILATTLGVSNAFVAPVSTPRVSHELSMQNSDDVAQSRKEFMKQVSVAGVSAAVLFLGQEPALARGRATLEKAFERYAPRVRAGSEFYKNDLRKLIEKNDWAGIKAALQEPPSRQKGDLNKADAGVAERARQAGGFSDARVLVAADLLAAAFSDNSISAKTKKMQASVATLREVVEEMQKVCRLALGEEKTGGLFGIGAKKADQGELVKQIRTLYVQGGNAWNEYLLEANDELALQFTRFDYIS